LPFIFNRISPDLRRRIALIALLGIEPTIDFNLHLSDLLRGRARSSDLPVLPEARTLDPTRTLCIAGTEEPNSLCSELKTLGIPTIRIEGGHHFGGHYRDVAGAIIAALKAGQP
jgi:type IV secretory pathway VirJ component